jgi:hypothetical protein
MKDAVNSLLSQSIISESTARSYLHTSGSEDEPSGAGSKEGVKKVAAGGGTKPPSGF